MSIATSLTALDNQRRGLAQNLTTKGVVASETETLAQLVPKVLSVPQEGGGVAPGAVSLRSAVLNPVLVTALSCNVVLPTNMKVGDLIIIGYFVRSASTLPAGYQNIGTWLNNNFDQETHLISKIATATDIGSTVVISQAVSGRINASAIVLKSTTGFAVGTVATSGSEANPTIPVDTATVNNSVAVLVSSRATMNPDTYCVQGGGWLTTTTLIPNVADLRLIMGLKYVDAGDSIAGGTIISTGSGTNFAQVAVVISPQ